MLNLSFFLEIGNGCLQNLPRVLKGNGFRFRKGFVLFDEGTYSAAGKRVCRLLRDGGMAVEEVEIGDSRHQSVDMVRKEIEGSADSCVFGVGGGKVIDTGKYAAGLEGIEFASIATAPSNDGIASPVAVIDGQSLRAKMPIGLVADLEIIRGAPFRNIRAGIGDLIANLSAVEDWRLANRVKGDDFNDFAALLAESGALLVLNTGRPDILSYEFLRKLVYGLVLSGIAINTAGSSRPASGGEHEISHAIDALYPGRALHGEQVALGTLFTLYLQRNGYSEQVRSFFKHCGLPVSCSELGLSPQEFAEAVACAPSMRQGRHTILEEVNMDRARILNETRSVLLI